MHLPGHDEHEPWRAFQHLEKRYFEVGPEGFQVWRAFGGVVGMVICNDRRWPEAYRVLGLQGVGARCSSDTTRRSTTRLRPTTIDSATSTTTS